MPQKIVVKVPMHCHKCRTKALKIAAAAYGVSKVSIEGADKDLVEVVGDNVDSVCLTRKLRKKLCCDANIVKVEEVKKEAPKPTPPVIPKPTPPVIPKPTPPVIPPACPQYCPPPPACPPPTCPQYCPPPPCPPRYCQVVEEYPEPGCSIM